MDSYDVDVGFDSEDAEEMELETVCDNELIDKGNFIASLLGLKAGKDGRYDTSWGSKTPMGLYRCILCIVESDSEELSI